MYENSQMPSQYESQKFVYFVPIKAILIRIYEKIPVFPLDFCRGLFFG